MGGRIAVGEGAVAGPRDHRAVAHDDAADRHLARRLRGAGFFQRDVHERMALSQLYPSSWPGLSRPSTSLYTVRHDRRQTRTPRPQVQAEAAQDIAAAARGGARRAAAQGRRAHRQGDGAGGPRLAPRGGGLDRGGARFGQRRDHHVARAQREAVRTASASTASRCRSASARGCSCSTSRAAWSPPRADTHGRPTIFGALPEGPAAADQRRPARPEHRGAAAAHQRRRARPRAGAAGDRLAAALPRARLRQGDAAPARRTARTASRSTASATARSKRRSTASRARTSGSRSRCARARTARSATCCARSACR